MKTERVTILVTPEERAVIAAKADAMGLNASEFLRLAADTFDVSRDEALLAAVVDQLKEAIADINASLDRTNTRVEKTVKGLRDRRLARRTAAEAAYAERAVA